MSVRKKLFQTRYFQRFNHTITTLIKRLGLFERILLTAALIGLIGSVTLLSVQAYIALSTPQPARGGALYEAVTGSPRFINPVLTLSQVDRDISSLIYAGLYSYDDTNNLIPVLAQSSDVSSDGLTYTVTLKEDITFHDGTPVTAADVAYTIALIQNPVVRSHLQGNWSGVRVEQISDRVIQFRLERPYAPFIHNLTLGILPAHVWNEMSPEEVAFSEYNVRPIGAGPYELEEVVRDRNNRVRQYILSSFEGYALKEPYISSFVFTFSENEQDQAAALQRRNTAGITTLPHAEYEHTVAFPLQRIFAVFFNTSEAPLLRDDDIREALARGTDREEITKEAFNTNALPVSTIAQALGERGKTSGVGDNLSAQDILEEAGWHKNEETGIMEKTAGESVTELSFTLTTPSIPELTQTAHLLAQQWRMFGVSVEVIEEEINTLVQNVLRPRTFEALLFGQVVGHDRDLFGFWHSTQRGDPGLNIAGYTNAEVDSLLEQARTNPSGIQDEALTTLSENLEDDSPAIFVATPKITYVKPRDLRGIRSHGIVDPSERFNSIHTWYLKEKRVIEL